ncbi:hypothetical protein ABT294_35900 [Nonomuraea sp. NPDC000554]|uniref:hypothetical protein n=1 Tax=Nonomuraea sp. NPDC000554 TaxID=3154259 RepID=UPI0033287408
MLDEYALVRHAELIAEAEEFRRTHPAQERRPVPARSRAAGMLRRIADRLEPPADQVTA